MGKQIQLSIADPCHENWDQMTAAEQGRFCASCQKEVMDFTNMSDAQLAAFFKKASTGSVCGRFYGDQLNRNIQIPKKAIPWIKYFFQIALPAFLMSAKLSAQGKAAVKKTETIVAAPSELWLGEISTMMVNRSEQRDTIKGRVIDENNDPVPYANIMIKGSERIIVADKTGFFTINDLPDKTKFILEIASVGYEPKEIKITKHTNLTKELVIRLNMMAMGFVSVIPHRKLGKLSVRTVSKASNAAEQVMTDTTASKLSAEKPGMIKVYPNPVLSGSPINIGCEKLEEGYYTFQLLNPSGQQIENKQVWIGAEAGIINIEMPSVTAGTYILAVTHKESGKRFSEKIIVQ